MSMRVRITLAAAIAAALGAAPAATSPAGGQAVIEGPPPVAAIADSVSGEFGQPVKAIWRDPVTLSRYHLALEDGVDLTKWSLVVAASGWTPEPVRMRVTFREGIPTAVLLPVGGGGDPTGSATAIAGDGEISVDIPGVAGETGIIRVSASRREGAAPGKIVTGSLAPVRAADLASVPSLGLSTARDPLVVSADGQTTAERIDVPTGPVLRRAADGLVVSAGEANPSVLDDSEVVRVYDRIFLRAGSGLTEKVSITLLADADGFTAFDSSGDPIDQGGTQWRVDFDTGSDGAARTAELPFELLTDLAGSTVSDASRVGVVRLIELADERVLVLDGIDAQVSELPMSGLVTETTLPSTDEDSSPTSSGTVVLIVIGVGILLAVIAPTVYYRVLARRMRRH